jgi:Zn-dependent metalloprotease
MLSGTVRPDAQFHTFALATVNSAERLFGPGSSQAQAVSEAWSAVGVLKGVRALDAAIG